MGGRSQRPNPEDYKPGPAEKMNAAIAKRSNDYFVTKLEPMIKKQIEDAATFSTEETVRGFRNADIQQALNNQLDASIARDFEASSNKTLAAVNTIVEGNAAALKAKRMEESAALKTGAGRQTTAAGALSEAAKQETATALMDAQSDMIVRKAKADMKFQALAAGAKAFTGNLASFNTVKAAGGNPGDFNPFLRYGTQPAETDSGIEATKSFFGFNVG